MLDYNNTIEARDEESLYCAVNGADSLKNVIISQASGDIEIVSDEKDTELAGVTVADAVSCTDCGNQAGTLVIDHISSSVSFEVVVDYDGFDESRVQSKLTSGTVKIPGDGTEQTDFSGFQSGSELVTDECL